MHLIASQQSSQQLALSCWFWQNRKKINKSWDYFFSKITLSNSSQFGKSASKNSSFLLISVESEVVAKKSIRKKYLKKLFIKKFSIWIGSRPDNFLFFTVAKSRKRRHSACSTEPESMTRDIRNITRGQCQACGDCEGLYFISSIFAIKFGIFCYSRNCLVFWNKGEKWQICCQF